MSSTKEFLKVSSGKIRAGQRECYLHGVNLGGWLMMEAYILHAPNLPEQDLKKQLLNQYGTEEVLRFEKIFRENFIQESDIALIKKLGLNCIRVPFNHRLIETKAYHYDLGGVGYLDRVIRWAKKNKIYVILDLHGACGSQNHDWHSDSYGQARLWSSKACQERSFSLWEFLANRYKNEEAVAGYDLLNEPILGDTALLNRFYKKVIRTIRSVDRNHILFIEGSKWAQDIDCLDNFEDDNYVLSVHNYEPINFTFNFIPYMSYPLKGKNGGWNKATTKAILRKHQEVAQRHGVPVFVGEFGVNYRMGLFNEQGWLTDCLENFRSMGFHWTYWTYKAIKNSCFPDGLYSYYENPAWVKREGPRSGWNMYAQLWSAHQSEMARSWQTSQFRLNDHVAQALRNYA